MTTPTTPQQPEAKPSDHRVLWLMSEYATACCASDFKRAGQLWNEAARILLAASGKAGAVGEPSDERIDSLLADLDYYAREYEVYEYGLPLHNTGEENDPIHKLRQVVRAWAHTTFAAPSPTQPVDKADAVRLDWLEAMTHKGYCPAVVFDDDGHWAVLFDGVQSMPGDGPPFATSFIAGDETQWHDSIREAIDAAIAAQEKQQ